MNAREMLQWDSIHQKESFEMNVAQLTLRHQKGGQIAGKKDAISVFFLDFGKKRFYTATMTTNW